MILAAIDPGLDRVSVAYFGYDAKSPAVFPNMDARIRAHIALEHITTSSDEPLAMRLWSIARWLGNSLRAKSTDHVVIEMPGYAGQYAERAGRSRTGRQLNAKSIQLTTLAGGVIINTACDVVGFHRVELRRAQSAAKTTRLAFTRELLRKAGRREVKNGDDADAIGIGLEADWPSDTGKYTSEVAIYFQQQQQRDKTK